MLYADTAYLISQTITINDIGDRAAVDSARLVYVEVKSVGLKRKVEALATGLNISFKLILSDIAEYNDEKLVEYKGTRYNVLDVYIADDQSVELTVGLHTA